MKVIAKVLVVFLAVISPLVACQTPAVSPPKINSFTVSPNSLPVTGGQVTLTWDTSGDTARWIDQGIGDTAGFTSKTVAVNSTTVFTILATNSSGIVAKQSVTAEVSAQAVPATGFIRFLNMVNSGVVTEVKMDSKTLYPGNLLSSISYSNSP
jgi:hypothetical protein